MYVVCLDMEGVVVPEIWIAFAEATGIPEFKRTTRDEPDYDKLMKYRIDLLKQHGLGLKEVQEVISTIEPLEGAKEFLDTLRKETQVVILSDTFTQFAGPLIAKLNLGIRLSSATSSSSRRTVRSPVTRCAAKTPSSRQSKRCSPAGSRPSPPETATTTSP